MTDVLDHGSVVLIDSMASDQKVVGSARVSTGKGPEYTSKGPEADEKLIRFLMSAGHGTPFEHSVFQFYIKAPLFVVREWQRHRIGSFNEQSGRYAEFLPEFYIPDHVRVPDPNNKQSAIRVEEPDDRSFLALRSIATANNDAYQRYKALLSDGVAREMARMVLPLSLYTSYWWTVNCRSLLNFLMLRNAEAAQWEIVQYAKAIETMFAEVMPLTYAAFVDGWRVAP